MRHFHDLASQEYASLDIGEVNLECAEKLPGSEQLDIGRYVGVLDEWAAVVARTTDRVWHQFEQSPADFSNSAAYFRMLTLVTVLQRDIGVGYALDSLEESFDCTNSRLHFIHGIVEGHGGTCATLPVLYVAIGRRLGYPLYLVSTAQHLFVRWEDRKSGERFNIEATSRGFVNHSDEYYHSWPNHLNPQHVRDGWLLKSMTPQEELSLFYETRARCYLDWMDFHSAVELAKGAADLCGGQSPFRNGFFAIASMLHRGDRAVARYGFNSDGWGVVVEFNRERAIEPWEAWAVREAERELTRIEKIHVSRRQQGLPHIQNRRIIQLAERMSEATDAYFAEEITR